MSDMPANDQQTPVVPLSSDDQTSDGVISPQATLQSIASFDPLNPPYAGKSGMKKEVGSTTSVDIADVPGVQVVEHEPNVEISPEVQGWIEKVEQEKINIPEHIVVADKTATQPTGNYASAPVIVIPLTQQQMNSGSHQSVMNSIRWLATWCLRIMKKFGGSVVYRQE